MTLEAELQTFREEFSHKVDPAARDAMLRADFEIGASGVAQRAARAGDRAPGFILTSAKGETVCLSQLLRSGPVVLSFYRGGWCPYCNLELRALQKILPRIQALGASLVAISPQKPDASLSTAEKDALEFPVLSDPGCAVARQFGVAFELPSVLRPIYQRFGHDLPTVNGGGYWLLPIPATYLIAPDGVIALAFVDADYRNRLEPAEVVAALECLATRGGCRTGPH
jgi:peroxiredoxin